MIENELICQIERERAILTEMVIQSQKEGKNLASPDVVAQSRKLDELLNQLADLRNNPEKG